MLRFRHRRTVFWLLFLVGIPASLFLIPMEDRVSGPFEVRPAVRVEIRAPESGFLAVICCDEGDRVSAGALVARLEIPNLPSRIAQKKLEVGEAQARLRLLKTGPRYEEIAEQRLRVQRAEAWRDLAQKDLARSVQAFGEDVKRLEKQIAQYQAELGAAEQSLTRVKQIRTLGSLSDDELREAQRKCNVFKTQVDQAEAQKKAREALGTQEAEAEVVRRASALADARASLTLLEAGTRSEEIDVAQSQLARLQEEVRTLEQVQTRLSIKTSVGGLITTPRLKEKLGQYVHEGDLIAVVEEPAVLEAEITLAEQDFTRVQLGQQIELKARALPYDLFPGRVDRIASSASHGSAQSSVLLYCSLENEGNRLRTGMTGHARVYLGRSSVGQVMLGRAVRYLRTEFWW